jgi:hypothetical protein
MEESQSIRAAPEEPIVITKVKRRRTEVFPLYKNELKQLARGYASPVLVLFGVFAGGAFGFGISWCTATFSDPKAEMKIMVGFYVSLAMTALTFALSVRDWYDARQIVGDIEKETVEIEVAEPRQ